MEPDERPASGDDPTLAMTSGSGALVSPASRDKYIGRSVDRFLVEEPLGHGGMGIVYRGYDKQRRRPVAIKIFPEEYLPQRDLVRRFEREAKIVEGLDHPNIARILKTGHIENVPYYVMEYVEGHSLARVLEERGRIGGRWCVEYLRQAILGLREAAAHNVTHRDIKPANIMIGLGGVVKIIDFGIAKAALQDSFRTVTGEVIGTAMYMSPEQAQGRSVDLRADIYSLGATFYHVVTGRYPFEGDNILDVMLKHVREPL